MSSFSAHLITHEKTHYDWHKLTSMIDADLLARECEQTRVHNHNELRHDDIAALDVFAFMFFGSLYGFRWRRFLAANSGTLRNRLSSLLTHWADLFKSIGEMRLLLAREYFLQSKKACLRSINISYSHLGAWKAALSTGSAYALVFEDDGTVESAEEFSLALDFVSQASMTSEPSFFNLSQSFRFSTLGVREIVGSSEASMIPGTTQEVIVSRVPFTNTLCAVAYSRSLLQALVPFLESALQNRKLRSIAIDFQVNRFIVEEATRLGLKNIHFNPGVVRQGSIIRKKPLRDLRS
jgi:hypothetical protein